MGGGVVDGDWSATVREHWLVLAMSALLKVAVSVLSARLLCALIESPIVAPQRESPGLYVGVVALVWAAVTAAAWGLSGIGSRAAGLTGAVRRRWRLLGVGLVVATWIVVVLLYATDPLTARRWAVYWPVFYG